MAKTVYIIIGCDVDPDRRNIIPNIPERVPGWNGLNLGAARAREYSGKIVDERGKTPRFSWCLRVDSQIGHYYDDWAWVLKEHKALLDDLVNAGDELAWHPHFWRWDKTRTEWSQETDDREWQVQMLKRAFRSYRDVFPDDPLSVRMGWNYHNSDTMATLAELGIKIDFSAVPGMKLGKTGFRQDNIYDWYRCPLSPYRPNRDDYQIAGTKTEALPIVEIPNLVSRSLFWGMVAGLRLAGKMKDIRPVFRSLVRPRYFINVTAKPFYFRPILNQFQTDLRNNKEDSFFFNCYFHADEMAPNASGMYAAEYYADNIKQLIRIIRNAGAVAIFIKASEAADLIALS